MLTAIAELFNNFQMKNAGILLEGEIHVLNGKYLISNLSTKLTLKPMTTIYHCNRQVTENSKIFDFFEMVAMVILLGCDWSKFQTTLTQY